jgi:hypothetical protein
MRTDERGLNNTFHARQAFTGRASFGGVPERSKGTDCKSVATGFEGSNPSPSTRTTTFELETTIKERGTNAGVAQLVELQPSKLDVAGSRPVSRSKGETGFAHLAQLAEHVLGKDEVTSSILVVGSGKNSFQAKNQRESVRG